MIVNVRRQYFSMCHQKYGTDALHVFFQAQVFLKLGTNCECHFTDIPIPHQLPQPCSIQQLVEHYLDIQGVPRRYFFELLSHFTSSELEQEKLQEFCSADGQVLIYVEFYKNHQNVLNGATI